MQEAERKLEIWVKYRHFRLADTVRTQAWGELNGADLNFSLYYQLPEQDTENW